MVDVEGPHPASNAGTVIAAINPVNKGETVGCLDLATLRRIGILALTGSVDFSTTVAVTGSEVKTPRLVETVIGAEMSAILKTTSPMTDVKTRHIRERSHWCRRRRRGLPPLPLSTGDSHP